LFGASDPNWINVSFDRKLSAIAESGVNLNAGNSGKAKTELDVSIF
jgi:hypothetical protein